MSVFACDFGKRTQFAEGVAGIAAFIAEQMFDDKETAFCRKPECEELS